MSTLIPQGVLPLVTTSVTQIGGVVGWSNLSDARFKTHVSDDDVAGLAFINALRPVTYHFDRHKLDDWSAEQTGHRSSDYPQKYDIEQIKFSGFLAQEVAKAAHFVGYDFSGISTPKHDRDMYALRYAEFVVPLVKAVQELADKNDILEEQNVLLLERMDRLEARMEQLENGN